MSPIGNEPCVRIFRRMRALSLCLALSRSLSLSLALFRSLSLSLALSLSLSLSLTSSAAPDARVQALEPVVIDAHTRAIA